jgi:hypothetical protein
MTRTATNDSSMGGSPVTRTERGDEPRVQFQTILNIASHQQHAGKIDGNTIAKLAVFPTHCAAC